jgi:4-hydroxybenzoate polyprenyltransferase
METLVDALRRDPRVALRLPGWLLAGRARLKAELAARGQVDVAGLPFHAGLLAWLREERARGRTIVLATASHRSLANAVADHLGLFDEVIATGDGVNVKGRAKADALVARFGAGNFDYAGDAPADRAVWRHARQAVPVGLSPRALRRVPTKIGREFPPDVSRWRAALRAMRPHQWLKNLLVFVPMLTAHRWADVDVLVGTVVAFVAFGLCASGAYLANDLFDLAADRRHPRKRLRPIAAGALPLTLVAPAAPLLAAVGLALGAAVDLELGAVLAGYLAVTLAYSWVLKRYVLLDTMTLAGLYTTRLVAGGAAGDIVLSFWLLAFSMFLFLSLGMVKRYSELQVVESLNRAAAHGRDYRVSDRSLLGTMGVASGMVAVLVFALYLQSPAVLDNYLRPRAMWLLCPLLLYWINRMWIKAARGEMHDDPLVFAVRDRAGHVLLAAMAAIVVAAGPL